MCIRESARAVHGAEEPDQEIRIVGAVDQASGLQALANQSQKLRFFGRVPGRAELYGREGQPALDLDVGVDVRAHFHAPPDLGLEGGAERQAQNQRQK